MYRNVQKYTRIKNQDLTMSKATMFSVRCYENIIFLSSEANDHHCIVYFSQRREAQPNNCAARRRLAEARSDEWSQSGVQLSRSESTTLHSARSYITAKLGSSRLSFPLNSQKYNFPKLYLFCFGVCLNV